MAWWMPLLQGAVQGFGQANQANRDNPPEGRLVNMNGYMLHQPQGRSSGGDALLSGFAQGAGQGMLGQMQQKEQRAGSMEDFEAKEKIKEEIRRREAEAAARRRKEEAAIKENERARNERKKIDPGLVSPNMPKAGTLAALAGRSKAAIGKASDAQRAETKVWEEDNEDTMRRAKGGKVTTAKELRRTVMEVERIIGRKDPTFEVNSASMPVVKEMLAEGATADEIAAELTGGRLSASEDLPIQDYRLGKLGK